MELALTAVFKKVPEGYIAFVEELPGADTQGETLEEARENLREAVELVLDANRAFARAEVLAEAPRPGAPSRGARLQLMREGGRNSVYMNRGTRKASSVPRHREINELLARKICRDLEVPLPAG